MSCSSISSLDTTYNSDIETSSGSDSEEDSSSSVNSGYNFDLDDLLPIKLNLSLTKNEEILIDEFYQKMEEIERQNNQEREKNICNPNINCTEESLKRIKCLVDKYLKQGIRLNLSYNGSTVTNLVFEKIKDIADSTVHFRDVTYATPEPYRNADYNNNEREHISQKECTSEWTGLDEKYADEWKNINGKHASEWEGRDEGYVSKCEYLEEEHVDEKYISEWEHWEGIGKCEEGEKYIEDEILKGNCLNIIESIISNLWMMGGRIERSSFYYNGLAHITCDIDCNLFAKCRKIESELKDVAYESVINKQKDDFKVAIDNGYFYIKYGKSSIVELTEVTNSQTIEDLNLKVGILQIGESVIRLEKLGEKRNYTDIPQGMIKMSFTTEVGKISIHLYPDKTDNNKIKVELDEESQEKLNKLKDKSNLGKNCLLGGKSVMEAIRDGEFTKNQAYEPSAPSIFVEQTLVNKVFNNLKGKFE